MYELFVDKTSKISRYIQRKTLYRVACKQRSRQELKLMPDIWMLEQSMHQAKKQQASWRKSGDGGGKEEASTSAVSATPAGGRARLQGLSRTAFHLGAR